MTGGENNVLNKVLLKKFCPAVGREEDEEQRG